MPRESASEHPRTWKDALHHSLFRSQRPLKELADLCGVSRQLLQAAADEDQPHAHLCCRHLPALAKLCSNLAWLDFLEHCAGRVAFRLPQGHEAKSFGVALRELGEWAQAHGEALEDGIVTADELAHVEKEAADAVAALMATVAQLRTTVMPPPGAPSEEAAR